MAVWPLIITINYNSTFSLKLYLGGMIFFFFFSLQAKADIIIFFIHYSWKVMDMCLLGEMYSFYFNVKYVLQWYIMKPKPTTVVVYHNKRYRCHTNLSWALEHQLQLDNDVSCCPRVDLLSAEGMTFLDHLKGGPQVIEVLGYRVTSLDWSLLPRPA